MKQNADKLITTRGTRLDVNRAKWCIYANIKIIYDLIYEQLVEALVAVEHCHAKMRNEEGEIITNDKDMVGLPSKYELIEPDYLLFVDKIGSNLYCDHNNNVVGEKHILSVNSDYATI